MCSLLSMFAFRLIASSACGDRRWVVACDVGVPRSQKLMTLCPPRGPLRSGFADVVVRQRAPRLGPLPSDNGYQVGGRPCLGIGIDWPALVAKYSMWFVRLQMRATMNFAAAKRGNRGVDLTPTASLFFLGRGRARLTRRSRPSCVVVCRPLCPTRASSIGRMISMARWG